MTDYQQMYEQKNAEFEELNEQFLAYQCISDPYAEQSTLMIEEIEKENEDLKNKNHLLQD